MAGLRLCSTSVLALLLLAFHLTNGRHLIRRADDSSVDLDRLMATVNQLQAEIIALKGQIASSTQVVTFMVSVPDNEDLSHNPRVHFASPDLNVGSGFHDDTDSFVAPVSGLYVFFLKVTGESGDYAHYLNFVLKKDGTVIAETETNDGDNLDRASVQVIVGLQEGQAVWVEKMGGAANSIIGGGVLSTFGGYLLHAGVSF